jgi:hypothetical protein
VIQLTEQMFEEAKRMAALDERRKILRALRSYVPRHGENITLTNFEGDLGLVDHQDFYHLEAIFKNGNRQPTSA